MLDINTIKNNTKAVKEAITNKGGADPSLVDEVIAVDKQWRALVQKTESLRNDLNTLSSKIGKLMGSGEKEEAQKIIKQTSSIKSDIKDFEEELEQLKESRFKLLLQIPNIPHSSVPVGKNENDNNVFKTWGTKREESWLKPHWELADKHHWIDFERGSKTTGAGFPFYLNGGARLQRALINYFLDKAVERGYTEMQPPYFVNEDSARGTGQIPDKEDMMYTIPRDGFFNIPTAEVPVTNFHRDEILDKEQLPLRYVAYTPCWRREAGSYGADVRGLNRLHQFDKVELVKIVEPDNSYGELESLRSDAESLLEELGLPYRTLLMCTGDMGFTQSKKYDLEVWSPGQQQWLEVSSCSNFTSFQARRLMLRYKDEHGNNSMLHTLNGSGLALPRVVAAILETYQNEEGEVNVPDVLQSYIGRGVL